MYLLVKQNSKQKPSCQLIIILL